MVTMSDKPMKLIKCRLLLSEDELVKLDILSDICGLTPDAVISDAIALLWDVIGEEPDPLDEIDAGWCSEGHGGFNGAPS